MGLVLRDALDSNGEENDLSVLKSFTKSLWTLVEHIKAAIHELYYKPPLSWKQPESQ